MNNVMLCVSSSKNSIESSQSAFVTRDSSAPSAHHQPSRGALQRDKCLARLASERALAFAVALGEDGRAQQSAGLA